LHNKGNLINFIEEFLSSTFTFACFHPCALSEKIQNGQSQREYEESINLSLFGFQTIMIIKCTRFINRLFLASSLLVPVKITLSRLQCLLFFIEDIVKLREGIRVNITRNRIVFSCLVFKGHCPRETIVLKFRFVTNIYIYIPHIPLFRWKTKERYISRLLFLTHHF